MCCVSLCTPSRWPNRKEQKRWLLPSLSVPESRRGEQMYNGEMSLASVGLGSAPYASHQTLVQSLQENMKIMSARKRNLWLCYSLNLGHVSTQFDHSYGMTVIAFSTGHYASKESNVLPSVTLMQSPQIYFFYHFSQRPSKSSTCQLHICLTALGIFLKQ